MRLPIILAAVLLSVSVAQAASSTQTAASPVYSGPAKQYPPGVSLPPLVPTPVVTVRSPCAWTNHCGPNNNQPGHQAVFPDPAGFVIDHFVPGTVFFSR